MASDNYYPRILSGEIILSEDSDNYYPSILSGEIILSEDGHKAYKVIKKVRISIVAQNILCQILCTFIF